MTLKDMVSQDGSLTDKKIIKKERIFKSHQTSFKLNSERILKDYTKSDATKVLDTNGVSKLEVNILKQLVEEERLSVYKERKSDFINLSIPNFICILFCI